MPNTAAPECLEHPGAGGTDQMATPTIARAVKRAHELRKVVALLHFANWYAIHPIAVAQSVAARSPRALRKAERS